MKKRSLNKTDSRRSFKVMFCIASTLALGRSYAFVRVPLNSPRWSRSLVTIKNSVKEATITSTESITPPSRTIVLPSIFEQWLDIELPEGRCIGVKLKEPDSKDDITPELLSDIYHPEEIAFGLNQTEAVSRSFWLGRLALRLAVLKQTDQNPEYPILKDSHGRPQLLGGEIFGSISHKQEVGIALVSKQSDTIGVGIDIEHTLRPGKRSIATRVLTDNEQQQLGKIPGISPEEEVMLRFSLKEAIYKAAHPLLCQYVAFKEAEVTPHPDGTATCKWFLESGADKSIASLNAHWKKLDDYGYFLTSARAQ